MEGTINERTDEPIDGSSMKSRPVSPQRAPHMPSPEDGMNIFACVLRCVEFLNNIQGAICDESEVQLTEIKL